MQRCDDRHHCLGKAIRCQGLSAKPDCCRLASVGRIAKLSALHLARGKGGPSDACAKAFAIVLARRDNGFARRLKRAMPPRSRGLHPQCPIPPACRASETLH